MNDSRRQYLEAMDIQLWERRRPPTPPAAAVAQSQPAQPVDIVAAWSGAGATGPPPDAWFATSAAAQPVTAPANRAARIARLDWDELQADVSECTACALHAGRTQTVFGVGARQARWMIIGEAPGADEDRLGEPFVGRAGKLLDEMLKALGLQRGDVYIANILKCRPPDNRDPLPDEARCCWPYLERQIALLQPGIILAVGRVAAQALLQTETPVGKLRGRVYRLTAINIPVVVSYHPAYLLRSPREKRKSWEDLQLARRTLSNEPATTRSTAA